VIIYESILLNNLQQNACVVLSEKVQGNLSGLMQHKGHIGRKLPPQATSIWMKYCP
jgi:hypothetical protein